MVARTCSQPGCPLIIPDGEKYNAGCARCEKRKAEAQPWGKRERLNFYSTARWQKLRRSKLMDEPICRVCSDALATEVDHIISVNKLNPELWFDWDNLQPICSPCHKAKTAAASRRSRALKIK